MLVTLITQQDLENFKTEVLQEIRRLHLPAQPISGAQPRYLKSSDIVKLLRISRGTLHSLRQSGALPCKRVGRVFYYLQEDVQKLLQNEK